MATGGRSYDDSRRRTEFYIETRDTGLPASIPDTPVENGAHKLIYSDDSAAKLQNDIDRSQTELQALSAARTSRSRRFISRALKNSDNSEHSYDGVSKPKRKSKH